MEEHWITPVDTLTLTRAKSFGSTNGYGLLGTRGGKALPQLWWGCALAILPTCVLPTLGKSLFSRCAKYGEAKDPGRGLQKLDAQDFLRGTSSV